MVKIITVHGTFAGDEADEGEKWWQRGSPFLTELQDYIEEPLEVEPFHWSGANSEIDRRQAGTDLAETITESTEPPIVIGHSHGGSSGIQALLYMFLKQGEAARDRLRGFVTIGTPMIHFKSDANPFTKFSLVGRILFLVALSSLLVATFAYFGQDGGEDFLENVGWLVTDPYFWLALVVFGVLFAYSRRNVNRIKIFKKNGLYGLFGDKSVSFSHEQDEAINALTRGKDARPNLVNFNMVFAGVFAGVSLLFIVTDFVDDLWQFVFNDSHYTGNDSHYTGIDPVESQMGFINENTRDGRAWRLYVKYAGSEWDREIFDYTTVRGMRTRKKMLAIPLADLWKDEEVKSFVDALPEDAGVFHIKNSVPDNVGYVFVEPDDEEHFMSVFLDRLGDFEKDFSSGNLDEEWLKGGYTSFVSYESLPRSDDLPSYLPPSLIVLIPHDQSLDIYYSGYLPINSRFLASSTAMDVLSDCDDILVKAQSSNNVFGSHLCSLFHAEPVSFLHYLLYQGPPVNTVISKFSRTQAESFSDNWLLANWFMQQLIEILIRVVLIIAFAGILAAVIAYMLLPVLSQFITGLLRGTAYGNDGHGEQVKDVLPGLDFRDRTIGNLPADVTQEMVDNSLVDAPAAINRLRVMLSDASLTKEGVDPMATATKFENSELIHNAYFHSSLFTRYLAGQMIEKFGLTPSARFRADEQAVAVQDTDET